MNNINEVTIPERKITKSGNSFVFIIPKALVDCGILPIDATYEIITKKFRYIFLRQLNFIKTFMSIHSCS